MVFDIVKIGSSRNAHVLFEQSDDVYTFDQDLKAFVSNMIETMFAANGVGLAAPQIGVNVNLFVMRTEDGLRNDTRETRLIINPQPIIGNGEMYKDIEGCLSVPELLGRVERHKELAYSCVDLEGKPTAGALQGLQARIYQHEFDHLRGILFVKKADQFFRPKK